MLQVKPEKLPILWRASRKVQKIIEANENETYDSAEIEEKAEISTEAKEKQRSRVVSRS
jgi:hypothetical protein